MPKYTEYDIVMNSVQKHPLEVAKAVNQLMADRISDLITAKRVEIANKLFDKDEDTDLVSDEELDVEDIELEDEDLEDFAMEEEPSEEEVTENEKD